MAIILPLRDSFSAIESIVAYLWDKGKVAATFEGSSGPELVSYFKEIPWKENSHYSSFSHHFRSLRLGLGSLSVMAMDSI